MLPHTTVPSPVMRNLRMSSNGAYIGCTHSQAMAWILGSGLEALAIESAKRRLHSQEGGSE